LLSWLLLLLLRLSSPPLLPVCLSAAAAAAAAAAVAAVVQVQALRSVEQYLGLEKLYVLGTNCVDNGPREGLEKFLNAASKTPETVLHYEVSCCVQSGVVAQHTTEQQE
jgi:7-hydroxymethyl chlorophyll a reductase